jgi:SAM-dependent methyltransferase
MITPEQERLKYEKTWDRRNYRLNSPGERSVPQFLSKDPERGTLIDFGCGTGRATRKLINSGFDAFGVDIANNAVDTGIPVEVACLWEKKFSAKWAYSCDVLEHIPTEHIDAVLDNMDTENCFLRVHLHEDKFGKTIGEVLHLTVKPHEWWLEKISKRWNIIEHESNGITSTFYGLGRANDEIKT